MAIYKNRIVEIGGYDEDFTGYAGEDSDFCNRMVKSGIGYSRTNAQIVHLWHGNTGDGRPHWENPRWVYNWNLLQERKDILIRNVDKEWGKIDV